MAVPSYTTDLSIYNNASSTSGWVEASGYTAGNGPETDGDYAIYGSSSITSGYRKTGLGSLMYGGSTVSLPTNGVFLLWFKFLGPNSLATLSSGGFRTMVGSSTSNFNSWFIGGSDTYQYGGWVNLAIDPTIGSADHTIGSPNGTYSACGIGCNQINAITKGNPFGVDIIRYGRGTSIFTQGQSGNYATFSGFALVNDNASSGRFGLIQKVGNGYLYKGLMSIGTSSTLVEMTDSNVNLTIDNTTHVNTNFNRIEIHNASSIVDWTSVNISSLSTVSRGQFEMIDNSTVDFTNCVFTDMSTFIFQSNATLDLVTFRRTQQVTHGNSSISKCTFDSITDPISLSSSNLNTITGCQFTSDGSNHAVELTSIGGGSMNWSNDLTGYASTDGSTGNESIFVNVGSGTLTINVTAGSSTPSIRTAGASVTVLSGQVTTTLKITNISGTPIEGARVYMIADAGGSIAQGTVIFNTLTDSNGEVSDTRSLSSEQPVTGRVRKSTSLPLYQTSLFSATIDNASGLNLTILMISDE